jgi:hypothetical protein
MTTENFCFYLQNRLMQTSQTGGQWYNDTSPFSIPCKKIRDLTGTEKFQLSGAERPRFSISPMPVRLRHR